MFSFGIQHIVEDVHLSMLFYFRNKSLYYKFFFFYISFIHLGLGSSTYSLSIISLSSFSVHWSMLFCLKFLNMENWMKGQSYKMLKQIHYDGMLLFRRILIQFWYALCVLWVSRIENSANLFKYISIKYFFFFWVSICTFIYIFCNVRNTFDRIGHLNIYVSVVLKFSQNLSIWDSWWKLWKSPDWHNMKSMPDNIVDVLSCILAVEYLFW